MDNYRASYGRPNFLPPVVKWLLISNVAVFLLGMLSFGDGSRTLYSYFIQYGALWPLGSEYFQPWQYLTTMFLHGGFMHLAINMFILWMFGLQVEQTLGSRRFLIFYLLSGLGASLLHSVVTMSDAVQAPAVGASGAIMGVMVAFGMLFPNMMVLVMFFLPMKAKYAVLLFIAIDLFAGMQNSPSDNVAHFAHLGGALTGFLLMKTGLHTVIANKLPGGSSNGHSRFGSPDPPRPRPNPFSRTDRTESARIIEAKFRDVPERPSKNAPVSLNFGENQERIDEILDKISEHGYQSLTEEEKGLLREASKKMENN